MSFADSQRAVVDELERGLAQLDCVVAVDVLPSDEPAASAEIEAVVHSVEARGTLPNAVLRCVLRSSLGIVWCRDANAKHHKRVLIR